MSFSIPNPFYEAAKLFIEARVKQEVARKLATSRKCGSPSCGHQPAVRKMDNAAQPGIYKILNESPSRTGIVYVNGQLHSVQPPGTNPPMTMADGQPEVRPGESATYSSAADHVHFAGGCPHCGLSRGLDGNLYDAKWVITTNITTGCIECPCGSKWSCVGGECVIDQNGVYTTLEACQAACTQQHYSCVNGECVVDAGGIYASLAVCQDNCVATHYSCVNGECVVDPQGPYTSIGLCNVACVPLMYSCDPKLGRCVVDPLGTLTQSQCIATCEQIILSNLTSDAKKNAQLPAKPCNCAKKAAMKNKPIDRKSIMM
jgi:hypothetical protein